MAARIGRIAAAATLGTLIAADGLAGTTVTQRFDLHLGGIRLADLTLALSEAAPGYTAHAQIGTTGLVRRFAEIGVTATATGRRAGARLVPLSFEAESRDRRKSQRVAIRYGAGRPQSVEADPPFKPKPWQIAPRDQPGTLDPLSAAVSLIAPQPRAALCNRSVEVFDGRRRSRLSLARPEPRGGRIRCEGAYRRVAGYRAKALEADPFPLAVWYAQGPDGLWHLVRAAAPTPYGAAVLTRAGAPG